MQPVGVEPEELRTLYVYPAKPVYGVVPPSANPDNGYLGLEYFIFVRVQFQETTLLMLFLSLE